MGPRAKGPKGKRPKGKVGPKGKGTQAAKRPVSTPSSSSEDEQDADQLAVLDQLLAMEQARGLAPVGPWEGSGGPSERGMQHSKQQRCLIASLLLIPSHNMLVSKKWILTCRGLLLLW